MMALGSRLSQSGQRCILKNEIIVYGLKSTFHDLGTAHLLTGEHLVNNVGTFAFNLGNGAGFSVLEVIQAAEEVVGQSTPYHIEAARAGAPTIISC